MKCTECQGNIDSEQQFCSHCGLKVEQPVETSQPNEPSIKKPLNRGLIFTFIGVLVFVIIFLVTQVDSKPKVPNSSGSIGTSVTATSLSLEDFCQRIYDGYNGYDGQLNDWRYNNVGTVQDLVDFSNSYADDLDQLASEVSAGISWDSGAIVSGFIATAAQDMRDIASYTQNGFFKVPVDTLLEDMRSSVTAVIGHCGSD